MRIYKYLEKIESKMNNKQSMNDERRLSNNKGKQENKQSRSVIL